MARRPAVVLGRRSEVLAWNPLGHALLAGHCDFAAPGRPADRPNLTRMLFLDPHTRELYARWEEEAARAVASLRLIAGRHPDDRELAELIGELTLKSAEFASLWSKHPVRQLRLRAPSGSAIPWWASSSWSSRSSASPTTPGSDC